MHMRHLYGEDEEERFVLYLYLFYLDAVNSLLLTHNHLLARHKRPS